jgi:hypothetical protein
MEELLQAYEDNILSEIQIQILVAKCDSVPCRKIVQAVVLSLMTAQFHSMLKNIQGRSLLEKNCSFLDI